MSQTVLYDERCRFCTELAMWLCSHAGVEALPIGSPGADQMLRDIAPDERYASVHVVDGAGRRRSAGGALPPLLRLLPGGRPLAALAEAFPGTTERAYRLVARNRGLLSRALRNRGAQSTASRSTTNTSGSCGSITPPAPRAP